MNTETITETVTTELPTPLMMEPAQIQCANEYTYSRKYIDRYIRQEIESNSEVMDMIAIAVQKIYHWLDNEVVIAYRSKKERLQPMADMEPEQMTELVIKMAITCAYCQNSELFTSVTGKLAHTLGWDDHKAAITTVAELLVPLHHAKLISITRVPASGAGAQYGKYSIAVTSQIPISDKLVRYVNNSSYLPPLICKPKTVTRNNQSGYCTFNDSVTLNGTIKEPLALDVINKQNQTALTLNLEFLLNVQEVPNSPLDTHEKQQAWSNFMRESNDFYLLIHEQSQSNTQDPGAIYFNHKYDLRGRMYCQGYHISYQGAPYKKAALELHALEQIEVPQEFQTT